MILCEKEKEEKRKEYKHEYQRTNDKIESDLAKWRRVKIVLSIAIGISITVISASYIIGNMIVRSISP